MDIPIYHNTKALAIALPQVRKCYRNTFSPSNALKQYVIYKLH